MDREKTHYEYQVEDMSLVYALSKPGEVFLLINVLKREVEQLKKRVKQLEEGPIA